jgi:putative ABC transport system ATP-binding protein
VSDVVLRADGLVKVFGEGDSAARAVDGVSLQIARGELVLIKGPSGSGKTTLLSLLGALMRPTAGRVELEGRDYSTLDDAALAAARARQIGFVFQAYNLLSALSVEENVLFPARLVPGALAGARTRAAALVDRLGLARRRHALPAKLSGGEKQRVAVARALINDPPLVLADEPTGNLDSQRGMEVAMILHDIARDDRRAVVIVTHDPRIEDIADRVLWLEDGRLREHRAAAAWARDPVCGMKVDRALARASAEYGGASYVFCSDRCRARFVEDPLRYVGRTDDRTPAPSAVQPGG